MILLSYAHSTEADISNLASDKASEPIINPALEDYIPKHAPKEIKMSYKSESEVEVDLLPEMDGLIKKHSHFEGKEVVQQVKSSYLDKLKNYFSEVYNSFKSSIAKIKTSMANILSKNHISSQSTSSSTKAASYINNDNSSSQSVNSSISASSQSKKIDKPSLHPTRISSTTISGIGSSHNISSCLSNTSNVKNKIKERG